jgi:hypothetical protein
LNLQPFIVIRIWLFVSDVLFQAVVPVAASLVKAVYSSNCFSFSKYLYPDSYSDSDSDSGSGSDLSLVQQLDSFLLCY